MNIKPTKKKKKHEHHQIKEHEQEQTQENNNNSILTKSAYLQFKYCQFKIIALIILIEQIFFYCFLLSHQTTA